MWIASNPSPRDQIVTKALGGEAFLAPRRRGHANGGRNDLTMLPDHRMEVLTGSYKIHTNFHGVERHNEQ